MKFHIFGPNVNPHAHLFDHLNSVTSFIYSNILQIIRINNQNKEEKLPNCCCLYLFSSSLKNMNILYGIFNSNEYKKKLDLPRIGKIFRQYSYKNVVNTFFRKFLKQSGVLLVHMRSNNMVSIKVRFFSVHIPTVVLLNNFSRD